MKQIRIASAAATLAMLLAAQAPADTVAVYNFDTLTQGTFSQDPSDAVAGASAGDQFGARSRGTVVNGNGLPFAISDDSVQGAAGNTTFPGDTQGIFGQAKADTDFFFGVVDLLNPNNATGTGAATFTFDISRVIGGLGISIDVGAMGDFEAANDSFVFTAAVDGRPELTVFSFQANEAESLAYRALDSGASATLNDPLQLVVLAGNAVSGPFLNKTVAATGALDTFFADLSGLGTGSTLTLTFTALADGGEEAFAFDNIVVSGTLVPEPSGLILCAVGLIGLGAAARRRRAA